MQGQGGQASSRRRAPRLAVAAIVAGGLILNAAPAAPAAAAAAAAADASGAGAGEEGLLVRFRPGHAAEGRADVERVGGEVRASVPGTGFSVVSARGRRVEEIRRRLETSGAVEHVELNRVRTAAALPNDSSYGSQSAYLAAAGFPNAWDIVKGSDKLVLAILDSGVDLDHPDLVDRLVPGWDAVNRDPVPDDDYGHGTMVAGVAAATTNNGRGVAGAAWHGKIMPVKVLDASGRATDANIAAGIVWAVDHGAHVINLSLGGPGASTTLQSAVDYATARNVVVVGAAGNDRSSVRHYPAACEGVIAVGATETGGQLASFSNYGTWIDINAPGVNIATTVRGTGDSYGASAGTSFAAPLVAGVALLMRAADPPATPTTVSNRLSASAADFGPAGFDTTYGNGFLRAEGAVRLSLAPVNVGAGTGPSSPGTGVRSGYWALGGEGRVYAFGSAWHHGDGPVDAADIESAPGGTGYWIVNGSGAVHALGTARYYGGVSPSWLQAAESVTSLSATPTGLGYWIFTSRGRVFAFGDAGFAGDMGNTPLNGPVLDSIPTPTGRGYYMVASDGGIFTFGDAVFAGSMGGQRLNAPVQSLVPNPTGPGYWLVAADGGIFALGGAPFRGSMGGVSLNAPVTGMVAFGNGYLMVGSDGGIFNFSDRPFSGSLGGTVLPNPIVSVAALAS